ncbi:MAG: SpaA isopeptide-forming pilin-related protein [Clostridium sp.]|nr:SpaA isopeptide-forming pilin-related protein [Clostridium sp.]MCM1444588.1 SpaA isopeptide-forming pilin-related protein [Candidatus Amulumruptor caecigallinarius]
MKKIIYILIALVTLLFIKTNVNAYTLERNVTNNYYYFESNGSVYSNKVSKFSFDGNIVYCVEPKTLVNTYDYTRTQDLSSLGLSSQKIEYIKKVIYFGYKYKNHTSDNYFLATQGLIWETIIGSDVSWYTGINKTGTKINIDNEKKEILSLIENSSLLPSFVNKTYKGGFQKSLTLTDNNNIINEFTVDNNEIIKGSNSITINFSTLGINEVNMIRKFSENTKTYLYTSGNSQRLIYSEGIESVNSKINYETIREYGKINVVTRAQTVETYNGSFIYDQRKIGNIKYELYAKDDIYDINGNLLYKKDELVMNITTDENGEFSTPLYIGSYYIKTDSEVTGYLKDENVYEFAINSKNLNVNLVLELYLKMSEIKLNKVFEVLREDFKYDFTSKEGVEFGLYTDNDIIVDGNVIIKKDTLLEKFITDGNGNILINILLPYNNYYVKELSEFTEYRTNNQKYKFELDGTKGDEYLSVDLGIIKNYLKKYDFNISLSKCENNCENDTLTTDVIELYKDDELINTYSIDLNKEITLSDIPYGNYIIKQLSNNKEYSIMIDKSTRLSITYCKECCKDEVEKNEPSDTINSDKNIYEPIYDESDLYEYTMPNTSSIDSLNNLSLLNISLVFIIPFIKKCYIK